VDVASRASVFFAAAAHQEIAWWILDGLSRLIKRYPDRIDQVYRIALSRSEGTLKEIKDIQPARKIWRWPNLRN